MKKGLKQGKGTAHFCVVELTGIPLHLVSSSVFQFVLKIITIRHTPLGQSTYRNISLTVVMPIGPVDQIVISMASKAVKPSSPILFWSL